MCAAIVEERIATLHQELAGTKTVPSAPITPHAQNSTHALAFLDIEAAATGGQHAGDDEDDADSKEPEKSNVRPLLQPIYSLSELVCQQ